MNEVEESGFVCGKVKAGEQCVTSKTHICNGEDCKPYPCGYFRNGYPDFICGKVKAGGQCVYLRTHICNGEDCKPYPCGYFRNGYPDGQEG